MGGCAGVWVGVGCGYGYGCVGVGVCVGVWVCVCVRESDPCESHSKGDFSKDFLKKSLRKKILSLRKEEAKSFQLFTSFPDKQHLHICSIFVRNFGNFLFNFWRN